MLIVQILCFLTLSIGNYDTGLRLTSETHVLDGASNTIGYAYDTVGTRTTRTISGKGSDTSKKTHTITATIVVSYKNINGKKLTYHVKNGDIVGQTIDFAPTGQRFKTVLVSGVSLGLHGILRDGR